MYDVIYGRPLCFLTVHQSPSSDQWRKRKLDNVAARHRTYHHRRPRRDRDDLQTQIRDTGINVTKNLQSDFTQKDPKMRKKGWQLDCLFVLWDLHTLLVKRLMKLTLGINFTKILKSSFFLRNCFLEFSLITIWICNFFLQEYWHKSCM